MWLSLFGFVLCVAIMFLIHWVSSLITFIVILALYLVVVYRKPDVNWGKSRFIQKITFPSAFVPPKLIGSIKILMGIQKRLVKNDQMTIMVWRLLLVAPPVVVKSVSVI